MNEKDAINLAVGLYQKHIIPLETYDDRELAVRQSIADLYKSGYEVAAKFKPNLTAGDIKRMADEEIIY